MMRGGHLDVCVLGAYQVSAGGDLANWHTGRPDDVSTAGWGMDLAVGAKQTFVMMDPPEPGLYRPGRLPPGRAEEDLLSHLLVC